MAWDQPTAARACALSRAQLTCPIVRSVRSCAASSAATAGSSARTKHSGRSRVILYEERIERMARKTDSSVWIVR
eukprot:SAG22_NODE_7_length_40155_cov_25.241356_4_plen_75_part_00